MNSDSDIMKEKKKVKNSKNKTGSGALKNWCLADMTILSMKYLFETF